MVHEGHHVTQHIHSEKEYSDSSLGLGMGTGKPKFQCCYIRLSLLSNSTFECLDILICSLKCSCLGVLIQSTVATYYMSDFWYVISFWPVFFHKLRGRYVAVLLEFGLLEHHFKAWNYSQSSPKIDVRTYPDSQS